jgi:hypothetical protein
MLCLVDRKIITPRQPESRIRSGTRKGDRAFNIDPPTSSYAIIRVIQDTYLIFLAPAIAQDTT